MANSGGRYEAKKGGKPKLVERTEEHASGNRPRDEKGNELRRQGAEAPVSEAPAQSVADAQEQAKA